MSLEKESNKIEHPPVEREEVQFLIDDVRRQIEEEDLGRLHFMPDNEERRKLLDRQNVIIGKTLQSLLESKERFSNVFVTESGSTYFVLASGESFRIKRNRNVIHNADLLRAGMPGQLHVEEMFKNIIFFDHDTMQEIDRRTQLLVKRNELLDLYLPLSDCHIGVFPVEFDKALGYNNHPPATALVRREGNGIVFMGIHHPEFTTEEGNHYDAEDERDLAGHFHFGTSVTQILH